MLSSVGVDDTWSAGHFGFYRGLGPAATQSFDNLDIWINNDEGFRARRRARAPAATSGEGARRYHRTGAFVATSLAELPSILVVLATGWVEIEMRHHRRQRAACLIGCVVAIAGGAAFSQEDALPTAEEVLDGYVKATGGKARYQRLRSRTSKGTFSIPSLGLTGRIETLQMTPDSLYSVTELEIAGKVERGYDGKVAWELNPLTGGRLLEGAERAFMVREATFNADLHWRKVCKKVELVGLELVKGEPAYKIAATTTDGASMTLYYDKYTNLLVRVDAAVKMQLGEVAVEVYPSDYRAVRGILVPHTATQKMLGVTQVVKFESIAFNKRIDKRRFKLPAAIEELVE